MAFALEIMVPSGMHIRRSAKGLMQVSPQMPFATHTDMRRLFLGGKRVKAASLLAPFDETSNRRPSNNF